MKKIILIAAAAIALVACKKQVSNLIASDNKLVNNAKLSVNSTAYTYYIDPSGDDSKDGHSTTNAWKTISKVNSMKFNPGDHILFKCGGSWSGQLNPSGSGIDGSPIVIDQYGSGNKPLIQGPGTKSSAGVLLCNQSYWEINNLEVTNYHAGGDTLLCGILVTNTNLTVPTRQIHINNCYVHDVNAYEYSPDTSLYKKTITGGIILYGYFDDLKVIQCHIANCTVEGLRTTPYISGTSKSTHVVFQNNHVDNVYGDGIVLNTVDHGLIDHNLVTNCCYGQTQDFAGCWTYNSVGTVVSNNEVYGISGGLDDGEAFDADQYKDSDIYEYNYSHGNAGGFILFMPKAKNIIVRYNVSVNDCTSKDKLINYKPTSKVNTLYNNVFYIGNDVTQIIKTGFYGTFNNNIIYGAGNVSSFCAVPVNTSSVFKNNCFYPPAVTSTNGPPSSASESLYTNPLFVNAGLHNAGLAAASAYKLTSSSPCLNNGIFISDTDNYYDFNHNLLPAANPDRGAFQH